MRIRSTSSISAAAFWCLLLASSCGGSVNGSGGNLTSGVELSKRLITLTDAERGQLCDWMVMKAGSYGNPGTCDRTQPAATYPFLTYDDQAACVVDAPDETETGCLATVAQMEACVNMLPACATLTNASNTPACSILSSC
jgi:hypothetical protein